jgi:hypothetical protein
LDDSSDQEAEETRQFLKSDPSTDIVEGDKIQVLHGELVGAIGIVKSVKQG